MFKNRKAQIERQNDLIVRAETLVNTAENEKRELTEDEAAELATHYSSSSLFALYDASGEAISALEAGANVRLTLISMMQSAGII